MWGFLVLVSGGFFYTMGAIMNAKATPNPTVVRYQAQAESMFVWHNIAKGKVKSDSQTALPLYSAQNTGDYKDQAWRSEKVSDCLVTYSVDSLTTERARSVTASLAKYATNGRSVGFIDSNGTVTASSDRAKIGGTFSLPNAKDTPYIHECL